MGQVVWLTSSVNYMINSPIALSSLHSNNRVYLKSCRVYSNIQYRKGWAENIVALHRLFRTQR
jgi:hypothetical protein